VFGLSGEKLLILGLIAVFVIGPDRLPGYAKKLATLIKQLRVMAEGAKGQIENEIGEELDWQKLDPRRYDPRRIIREALAEEIEPVKTAVGGAVASVNAAGTPGKSTPAQSKAAPASELLKKGDPAPFDSEAT
jgi:sec-independent protein translocase protein TatB